MRPGTSHSATVAVNRHDGFRDGCRQRIIERPMSITNLFAQIPLNLSNELVQFILDKPDIRIDRIVSQGHASPKGFWYDQEQSEFVLLLKGAARLRFEDGEMEMTPGSFVDIPAHRRHRVEWTESQQATIWLAVHYG